MVLEATDAEHREIEVNDRFIEMCWGGPIRRRWLAQEIRDVKQLAGGRYVWVEDAGPGFGVAFEDEDTAAAFVLMVLALIEGRAKANGN